MRVCLGLDPEDAKSREQIIKLNKRTFTEMGLISCDTGFNSVLRTPEACQYSARDSPGSLGKVMAMLSEEIPEMPWQVVEEKMKRHKEVGVLKWIYCICLKTPANQICSTFSKKMRGPQHHQETQWWLSSFPTQVRDGGEDAVTKLCSQNNVDYSQLSLDIRGNLGTITAISGQVRVGLGEV